MPTIHKRHWNSSNQFAATQHFNDVTIPHPTLNMEPNSNNGYNKNPTDIIESNDNDVSLDINNNNWDIENNETPISHRNNFLFMSQNSQQYFKLFEMKPNHVPAQFVVHAAFAQHAALSSQFCNMFETEFHLQATMLCLSTTILQHQQL